MKKFLILILLTSSLLPFAYSQKLVTIKAAAQSTTDQGRTLATARNHHFVIDAPPPLGGPNEALNPIEMLMSSLASCGVLVAEKVAAEQDISLTNAQAIAQGMLDPRGVKGDPVNPRIQSFEVELHLAGVTDSEAKLLVESIRKRCPIFTTLERAAPIEVKVIPNDSMDDDK